VTGPARSNTGVKTRVAELMADDLDAAAIAARLGVSVPTIYAYFTQIRRDLGPQARATDLGWRGGVIWHPGRA